MMVTKLSGNSQRDTFFSQNGLLRYLQRDPLKCILHLKMLTFHREMIETVYIQDGSTEGVLLLFPTTALSYDQQEYGGYELVAMPVADSLQILGKLLANVPKTGVVFKLINTNDESLIDELFDGKRARRFLNYSAVGSSEFNSDPGVVISSKLNDGLMDTFGKNGHTSTELTRFFDDGGKAYSIIEDGKTVSVGMVYRNFENIWEIAALYTIPTARRKGYSTRIVRTALLDLQQLGYIPRYVVDETNIPSVKLAQAIGLERFLTVIHYTT
jgi:hypothetical protein